MTTVGCGCLFGIGTCFSLIAPGGRGVCVLDAQYTYTLNVTFPECIYMELDGPDSRSPRGSLRYLHYSGGSVHYSGRNMGYLTTGVKTNQHVVHRPRAMGGFTLLGGIL